MTNAERRLWWHLCRSQLGTRFRRQAPIGRFIVDFVSFEHRLIIELDGGQHATTPAPDAARSAWLESQGFTVLRFWNTDVLGETEAVLSAIRRELAGAP
jgi:very-short-patch-repair endonuclease